MLGSEGDAIAGLAVDATGAVQAVVSDVACERTSQAGLPCQLPAPAGPAPPPPQAPSLGLWARLLLMALLLRVAARRLPRSGPLGGRIAPGLVF